MDAAVSSGDPAVVACKTRSPAPRCGDAGLMAMVMARGFRILVLSRKSFTGLRECRSQRRSDGLRRL